LLRIKSLAALSESIENIKLNERQKNVFQAIIQLYILNATPVGSRTLSKYLFERLSSATIRNVMADLEEIKLIDHQHASAGRVPTDLGYRYYVDTLLQYEQLSSKEIEILSESLNKSETLLKDASRILGLLSKYLSIVALPQIEKSKILKIDLIQITEDKLLFVLALDSNVVKTVTLEVDFDLNINDIAILTSYLNEKISGKSLEFIKQNFKEIVAETDYGNTPLIRLFIDSIDDIFDIKSSDDLIHIAGTQNLLQYPEFNNPEKMRGIIELIESDDVIIHILDKIKNKDDDLIVMIGSELQDTKLRDYSIVVSNYNYGSSFGTIGVIGPKRMNYSKIIALVKQVSKILEKKNYS